MLRAFLPLLAAAIATPSGADQWIPFTLTPGNQIRFGVSVDGMPAQAILDTGLSHSVLSRASRVPADRTRTENRAEAIGGGIAVGWASVTGIAIGGRTLAVHRLAVADIPAEATGGRESGPGAVDLLVGLDLLDTQAIDIDYPARRFRLLATGARPFQGVIAPLTRANGVPLTTVRIGAATLSSMVIDTGDGAAVTVTRAGWEQAELRETPVSTTLGIGLAGPAVTEVAHAAVAIGDAPPREAEVRIEAENGLSARTGAAGRIGSGLLGGYRVLLDPAAGRMVLAPGPATARPPLRSTTGLLVAAAPGTLRILHVMRGSPAAAAGLSERDRICAVDGMPIPPDYSRSPMARWPVAPSGTIVRLTLCDGAGERRLIARRFY